MYNSFSLFSELQNSKVTKIKLVIFHDTTIWLCKFS